MERNEKEIDNNWVLVEEQKSNCLECADKDMQLDNLRNSKTELNRERSQMVLLQKQYLGMAVEINSIKSKRDNALKKVNDLEISLADANTHITSLLSKCEDTENLIDYLNADNRDLQSILSKVSAAVDRLERYLKEETKYRQTVNSDNPTKLPCSSCSYKDQLFSGFRNEFVKAMESMQ